MDDDSESFPAIFAEMDELCADYDPAKSNASESFAAYFENKVGQFDGHIKEGERIVANARNRISETGLEPTEEQSKGLLELDQLVARMRRYAGLYPHYLLKNFAIAIAEAGSKFTDDTGASMRQSFADYGAVEKADTQHLVSLLTTEDILGILLRGHALVENMLDTTILAVVARPVKLHEDLHMFYGEKVKLAYALGLISAGERSVLSKIGKIRNDLVHRETVTTDTAPRYEFDANVERDLWNHFRQIEDSAGPWPEYTMDKFPMHAKLILISLWLRLYEKSKRAAKSRLSEDGSKDLHILDQHMQAAMATVIVVGFKNAAEAFID